MNRFEKVPFETFFEAVSELFSEDVAREVYDEIKLPKQATPGSAGHDFYSPITFLLKPGESKKVPTGIRCKLDHGKFLAVFPRSGLGFKFRIQLDNTVGIVDEDYYGADNFGHIFLKFTNDGREGKELLINAGDAMAQGIILSYEIAEGAAAESSVRRTGGFGSTGR